jgi:hypothetical protein
LALGEERPPHTWAKAFQTYFSFFNLILNTMKTITKVAVNFLRIYPVEQKHVTPNGVEGMRAGALVLLAMLPRSAGQKEGNAIELSPKQLDNLAQMHGIRETGKKGWSQLQTLIQVGKSACVISSEEHNAGDAYVDTKGVEQKFKLTSTNTGLDSIILPNGVTTRMIEKTIDAILSYDESDSVAALLSDAAAEPVAEGAK